MKNKYLLILTLLLYQTWAFASESGSPDSDAPAVPTRVAPTEINGETAAELKDFIDENRRALLGEINRVRREDPNCRNVVLFIGPASVGKTTVIGGMRYGIRVDTSTRRAALIPNTEDPRFIGTNGAMGTRLPAGLPFADFGTILWDLPGIDGPGGPAENIKNAMIIHDFFRGGRQAQVVLCVEEGMVTNIRANGTLLNLLNRITTIIPEPAHHASISLLCTKMSAPTELESLTLLEYLTEIAGEENLGLNDAAQNLFDSLMANPNRLISFFKPVTRAYDVSPVREQMRQALTADRYVGLRIDSLMGVAEKDFMSTAA